MKNRPILYPFLITLLLGGIVINGPKCYKEYSTKRDNIKNTAEAIGITTKELKRYNDEEVGNREDIENLKQRGITSEVLRKIKEKQNKLDEGRLFGTRWQTFNPLDWIIGDTLFKANDYLTLLDGGVDLWTMHEYAPYKLSLVEAMIYGDRKFNDDSVRVLEKHYIDLKKAVPFVKLGKSTKEIIETYAFLTGVSVEDKKRYMDNGINTHDKIQKLDNKGVSSQIVQALRGRLSADRIIELVDEGKLNGDVYESWKSDGFSDDYINYGLDNNLKKERLSGWNRYDFPIEETDFCLQRGHSNAREAYSWKENGFSVETMDGCKGKGYSLQEMIKFSAKDSLLKSNSGF